MVSKRRSITVNSEGREQTFTGDVDIRTLTPIGSHYILQDGEVVWQQRVADGQVEAAEFTFEGFEPEELGLDPEQSKHDSDSG